MPLLLGAQLLLKAKGAWAGYGRKPLYRNKIRGPLRELVDDICESDRAARTGYHGSRRVCF